ncbi:hypothetical protein OAT10_00060 [Luminiphilus sp.]|nr:hypothetical protein [Luminiphilus sp.]
MSKKVMLTDKELKMIIKEELGKIDEIFNLPFGKGPKGSQRSRGQSRGLSKDMEYDDFLDGLDKKGKATFDSAASYSDMKDQEQDKAFDKMDANTRDMVLDSQDMDAERMSRLETQMSKLQDLTIKMYNQVMNMKAAGMPDPVSDTEEAVGASLSGGDIPNKRRAFGQQFENKRRRRKRSK